MPVNLAAPDTAVDLLASNTQSEETLSPAWDSIVANGYRIQCGAILGHFETAAAILPFPVFE